MASKYVYYTIKSGDTLSEIAAKHGTTVAYLTELNNISNPDVIIAGKVLKVGLRSDADKDELNSTNYAKIINFGLMLGTTRDVFAQWTWSEPNTDHYEILWMYATGVGVGYIGSRTTTTEKQATWTAPENATHVTFQVKPVSKTYKPKGSDAELTYFTGYFTSKVRYFFSENPPEVPTGLSVEIVDNYNLTATINNIDINATHIGFEIVKDDGEGKRKKHTSGITKISDFAHVSYVSGIDPGYVYYVRCRGIRREGRENIFGEWTEYDGPHKAFPPAPKQIVELRAINEGKDIYISWSKVASADQYEIEYTTKKSNFDSSTDTPPKHTVDAPLSHAEIRDLELGKTWYFRIRAVNSAGPSVWTEIKALTIGTKPIAPTTWSSTTTAEVGDIVSLYWMHNSEDESEERYATVEFDVDGVISEEMYMRSADLEKGAASWIDLYTRNYTAGATIKWRVRTKGAIDEWGDWSVQRTINVYAPPSLSIDISSNTTLTSYPFYAYIESGPSTQTPISYHISVRSLESYETYDRIGNSVYVSENEEIYSKYIETSERELDIWLRAEDIDLRNNISYVLYCKVAMDTGLTETGAAVFKVEWDNDRSHYPNAQLMYNSDSYSMSISPYCSENEESLTEGVTLGVYRREFDGSFTEIASGLENNGYTFVTDPHPSLDFARYRITATDKYTGLVDVYDMPPVPIGEAGVIIQWNEEWHEFNYSDEPTDEGPAWTGSLLRLPFNVDVSENNSPDVALVNYIGREHPTSYYGTHIGQALSISAEIEATDKETIYALRRLSRWMGDVYVREPSGNGYWANVTVNFNQKHCGLVIPVSIEVKRVEGGV